MTVSSRHLSEHYTGFHRYVSTTHRYSEFSFNLPPPSIRLCYTFFRNVRFTEIGYQRNELRHKQGDFLRRVSFFVPAQHALCTLPFRKVAGNLACGMRTGESSRFPRLNGDSKRALARRCIKPPFIVCWRGMNGGK